MAPNQLRNRMLPATVLAAIVLIVASIVATTWLTHRPYDEETLCPLDQDYPRTALLIDATDRLSSNQIERVLEEIGDPRGRFEQYEWVGIFLLNEYNLPVPAVETARCNPGSGDTANPIYENPDRIQQRFEREFVEPLQEAINGLRDLPESPTSPIFEMIRAVALYSELNSTEERRLIIVSDMLQNVPQNSQYSSDAPFEVWRETSYGRDMLQQTSLLGIDVEVLYVRRQEEPSQSRQTTEHTEFWRAYFEAVGASLDNDWVRRLPANAN